MDFGGSDFYCWIGFVVVWSGGIVAACITVSAAVAAIYVTITRFWAARLYRPQLNSVFNSAFFRFMNKAAFGAGLVLFGVPDRIEGKDGVLWDAKWLEDEWDEW